jgi:RimJ/RimL family protein N-acetyltransferase
MPTVPALTTTLPVVLTDKLGQPFQVRSYEPSDRPALETMYREFEPKRVAQGLPPEREPAMRRWLDRVLGRGLHVVVEVGGRLLGHAMLIPMDDGGAELANFLHQSIRNRGIGTAVNRVMVFLARMYGFRRIWLSVEPSNRAAVRSYQKVGFRLLPGSLWAPEIEMELCLGNT